MGIISGLRNTAASLLISGFLYTSNAQIDAASDKVSAGNLYVMSENGSMRKNTLEDVVDIIKGNFDTAGITYDQASVVDTFPSLKPLDALVVYLDNYPDPKDFIAGKDDCPLSETDVGESDALCAASYNLMKQRLGFSYDKETVQGCVMYICPGSLIYRYMSFEGKYDSVFIEENAELLLASAATHEIGHTLGAVHVYSTCNPICLPAEGYFLGSILTFAGRSTRFHKKNIERMHEFISSAHKEDADMESLNRKKTLILYEMILQKPE